MRELVVNNYPKSSVTESIKMIRANLRFSSINKNVKTILVTSSIAGEGKSFISANLSAVFTTEKERVLLIDCDLRKGRQKELFDINSNFELGLSNLLIDRSWNKNLQNYIHQTEVKNLDILTNGTIPPNPGELLESTKIEKVIEKLTEQYDTIILDAPPVIGLTDSLILSRLADIVLIVAKHKKTPLELLESTKIALKNVNANIAGVIINRMDNKNNKYYKNYYYKGK